MTRSMEHTRPASPPPSYVLERRVNQPAYVIARTLRDRTKIAPVDGFALDTGTLVIDEPPRPTARAAARGQRSWRTTARLLGVRGQLVARVDIEIASWAPGSTSVQLRPSDHRTHRWGARRARRYFALAHAGVDRLERLLNDEAASYVPARDAKFKIRPIEAGDFEGLRALFWRLSPESVYFRFLAPVQRPPERFLHHLAEVDHNARDALVAVVDEQIVGVARYDRNDTDPRRAEVAVVVEDAWHRHGIATRLTSELSKSAHDRGIEQFTATVSADNRAIATFVRSLPVRATWAWDAGQRQLAIPLRHHIVS